MSRRVEHAEFAPMKSNPFTYPSPCALAPIGGGVPSLGHAETGSFLPPRMLIVCESSGVVREAMRAQGIDAWSCDLLPADDGSPYHIQGDALEVMAKGGFDAYGLHPPCTYLTVAGIHWNNRGRGWEGTRKALAFVLELMRLAGDAPWYLENPVSIISTHIRKPAQSIQPYDFGEDASKRTCLWLHRLPCLVADPARRVSGRLAEYPVGSGKLVERWSNQTDSGQNRLAPSADRWKQRSRTYPGIARAMAEQWAPIIKAHVTRKEDISQ